MRGNITIDPLARATAVTDPQIREVRSLKSGQILEARRFIESVRYDRLVQVRSQIKEAMDAGSPRVACAICGTAVYIVSSPDKAFFFRHRIEDGSCPAQTRDGLSEDDIRTMKYKGAQESEAHRRLKALIERSLAADSRFQGVLAEKVWRGQRDPTSLRRPDIQARLDGLRIAFEAQLTTHVVLTAYRTACGQRARWGAPPAQGGCAPRVRRLVVLRPAEFFESR